jgi:hypothetical protein
MSSNGPGLMHGIDMIVLVASVCTVFIALMMGVGLVAVELLV